MHRARTRRVRDLPRRRRLRRLGRRHARRRRRAGRHARVRRLSATSSPSRCCSPGCSPWRATGVRPRCARCATGADLPERLADAAARRRHARDRLRRHAGLGVLDARGTAGARRDRRRRPSTGSPRTCFSHAGADILALFGTIAASSCSPVRRSPPCSGELHSRRRARRARCGAPVSSRAHRSAVRPERRPGPAPAPRAAAHEAEEAAQDSRTGDDPLTAPSTPATELIVRATHVEAPASDETGEQDALAEADDDRGGDRSPAGTADGRPDGDRGRRPAKPRRAGP